MFRHLKDFSFKAKSGRRLSFTLIEVLLAVGILTVGLVSIIGAYIVSVNALEIAETNMDMVYLLKETMATVEQEALENGGVTQGVEEGEFEGVFGGVEWEIKIDTGEGEQLNEVEVTASNPNVTPPRTVTLTSYIKNKEEPR